MKLIVWSRTAYVQNARPKHTSPPACGGPGFILSRNARRDTNGRLEMQFIKLITSRRHEELWLVVTLLFTTNPMNLCPHGRKT